MTTIHVVTYTPDPDLDASEGYEWRETAAAADHTHSWLDSVLGSDHEISQHELTVNDGSDDYIESQIESAIYG